MLCAWNLSNSIRHSRTSMQTLKVLNNKVGKGQLKTINWPPWSKPYSVMYNYWAGINKTSVENGNKNIKKTKRIKSRKVTKVSSTISETSKHQVNKWYHGLQETKLNPDVNKEKSLWFSLRVPDNEREYLKENYFQKFPQKYHKNKEIWKISPLVGWVTHQKVAHHKYYLFALFFHRHLYKC